MKTKRDIESQIKPINVAINSIPKRAEDVEEHSELCHFLSKCPNPQRRGTSCLEDCVGHTRMGTLKELLPIKSKTDLIDKLKIVQVF